MRKRFTKDIGLHFNKGQIVDYDSMTWAHIERNLRDLGLAESLDDVTEALEDVGPVTRRKEPAVADRIDGKPKAKAPKRSPKKKRKAKKARAKK